MSKLRSVNTHFWSDTYVVDLDPIEKLLFLYLLTNEKTNMLGIYELHIRRISFDTGIDKDMVMKIFDRFEEKEKAKYLDGYVVLRNFIKHQSYNTNMQTSAINSWEELPLSVRRHTFCEPIAKGLEAFGKPLKPIGKIEVEEEEEIESEYIPTLSDVKDYFIQNGYDPQTAERAYNMYNASIEDHPKRQYWRDSRDNIIKNWKLKMQSVWFKDENKIQQSNVIDGGTF
jgi:hypothetical protein